MKMKFNNKLIALSLGALSLGFVSCENQDIEFPDYEGGISVYFPYQTPVRTLILGTAEDEIDTSNDKAHKCAISATMGGAYKGRNITVDIAVDESLVKNVMKLDGTPMKVLPAEYYDLSSNKIEFKGNLTGSVTVQLKDAFFADPLAATETYVIPVMMKSQTGADRILVGAHNQATEPAKVDPFAWATRPQDYVLYCVSYNSKYEAYYSRCGKYSLNGAAEIQLPDESTAKYKDHFDPVIDGIDCNTVTKALNQVSYTVNHKVNKETEVGATLILTFDESNNCIVTSATEGVTVTGTGKFTEKGAKKAWDDKDCDLLELNYTIDNGVNTLVCTERLVWKRTGVRPMNEFEYNYVAE